MARRGSGKQQQKNGPGGQRDWQDKPAGKIVIGFIVGVIVGVLLSIITTRIFSQRESPTPVVIEMPEKKVEFEDKATAPELAKPRGLNVQRTEDRKEREFPEKADPP